MTGKFTCTGRFCERFSSLSLMVGDGGEKRAIDAKMSPWNDTKILHDAKILGLNHITDQIIYMPHHGLHLPL